MLVQKFGGTSVANAPAITRLIAIVRSGRREGRGPAVVVSAMSGVTDALLGAASVAKEQRLDEAMTRLAEIRSRHLAATAALLTGARGDSVTAFVNTQLDQVESVLRGVAILHEVTPRTLDALVATGELLSSRLVSAALDEAEVPSTWVDARRVIVTNDDHTRALPLMPETIAALRTQVRPIVDDARVPVVGGFVGATVDGVTTTLGRGGSDYSGALVGAGLDADEIQIWTDVDGMLTADPRIVAHPKLVEHLSYAEASELAYFGAKVLHPSTILPAVEHSIPVRILNSRRPDGAGTLISASRPESTAPFVALACKRNLAIVNITSSRMLMAYGFLRRLFEVFERYRTSVDVVTTSEVSVSVTVDDRRHLEAISAELSEFAEVSVEGEMALLCAVGDDLQSHPTLTARLVNVLRDVPLRMISQAAVRRNITVVLRDADVTEAMQRLHAEFFT